MNIKAHSNGLSSPGFTPTGFIPPPNHMQPHSSTSPPRNIPPGFIPHPALFPPPIFQHPGHIPPGSIPPPGPIPPPGCIPPPTFYIEIPTQVTFYTNQFTLFKPETLPKYPTTPSSEESNIRKINQ